MTAVAEWADGNLTVWTGTQRPFGVRGELAQALGVPEKDLLEKAVHNSIRSADDAALLQTIADSAAHMTPEMMLSFLQQGLHALTLGL